MTARAVTIIQARMASRRLPRKVLEPIGGFPTIEWVVRRSRMIHGIDDVIVATTTDPSDDALVEWLQERSIPHVRGEVDDVLARFVRAAEQMPAQYYLRITGDCPLIDPELASAVLSICADHGLEYASNTSPPTFPDGLDVEAFSAEMLNKANAQAQSAHDREHVTPWMVRTAAEDGRSSTITAAADFSGLRWTLDEPADLEFLNRLVASTPDPDPERRLQLGWQDFLAALAGSPEIGIVNSAIERNEGARRTINPLDGSPLKLDNSRAWLDRAREVVPMQAQTFSKAPSQFSSGVSPNFLVRGRGARVWDPDDNEYIDYAMGLGPVILGHADPDVDRAAIAQIEQGIAFTLPHTIEVEVAELLREIIPCAEMSRFGKNGSDATSGAVRLARAVTGRELVLCCGYHGWQDWFIATTTRDLGIPQSTKELTKAFAYNVLPAFQQLLAQHDGEVAAVIMEPVGLDEPEGGFLDAVADATRAAGALLVFDEIVTGFRYDIGGVQAAKGVVPDLACFGKAMGNGYPVAALCGRRDYMKLCEEIFFSFTAGGDALGLAASRATIGKMRSTGAVAKIGEFGEALRDWMTASIQERGLESAISVSGYPQRWATAFADTGGVDGLALKSLFQQESLRRGVLFNGAFNPTYAHGAAEMTETKAAFSAALDACKSAIEQGSVEGLLEGGVVEAVFRKP